MSEERLTHFMTNPVQLIAAQLLGLALLCSPGAWAQDEEEAGGIAAKRETVDATVFEEAALAEKYGEAIVALWNSLREAENPLEVFRTFRLGNVEAPEWKLNRRLPEKIFEFAHQTASSGAAYLKSYQIQTLVNQYIEEGYQIDQADFRQADFEIGPDGVARSLVRFELNVSGPSHTLYRRSFRGSAWVAWNKEPSDDDIHYPDTITFESFRMYRRTGKPGFASREWLDSGENNSPYSYILVEDLDLDGLPDVIFPRANLVYLNVGDFRFDPRPLVSNPLPSVTDSALLIDLDLDGRRDYVVNLRGVGVLVFEPHKKTGKFSSKPKTVFKTKTLFGATSLSAGDVNGDGLPDLFIGQNVEPYVRGILPIKYYDANDGLSSYLLLNQGNFKFRESIGKLIPAEKSKRRNRSSAIVDFDGDGVQDLALSSNFAGLDLFTGAGKGLFEDRTGEWASEAAMLGSTMSIADFNADGALDLFVGGAASEVGMRLTAMGASRPGYETGEAIRGEIAQGSRLWLGNSGGGFTRAEPQSPFSRAGAVWGSADLDFNNDGYPDLFLTNGYLSKAATVLDYDEIYWRHDVYDAETEDRIKLGVYLLKNGPGALINDDKRSWFPHQKNKLLANYGEEGFVDIAYLMDVSSELDSRATVAEDLNGDGKTDLIALTRDSVDEKAHLNIIENNLLRVGNWIGVQLKPAEKRSVVGARVRVIGDSFEAVKAHVFGASRNVQPSSLIRFGIGESDTVKAIEIIWSDGQTQRLEAPEINRYHSVIPGA